MLALLFTWQADLEAQELRRSLQVEQEQNQIGLEAEIEQWSQLCATVELAELLDELPLKPE